MKKLIETTNELVITNQQMTDIVQLMYDTDFRGSDDYTNESLFEYGWLYDENTNVVITTRKKYTWDSMTSELKFRVFKLDEKTIDIAYSTDEELMLRYNNQLGPWDSLFILDKLYFLEILDSFLTKETKYVEYSTNELIEYLKVYINTHNKK